MKKIFLEKYFCLDCNKPIKRISYGIIGWLRTDGDMSIKKTVPGGFVYGKELGYVCDKCH